MVFTIGGSTNGKKTRSDVVRTIVAPSNVIDVPREGDEPQLCLVETVTSMDDEFFDAISGTRGTPIYTENFDDLYSDQLAVTAFPYKEKTSGVTGTEEYVRPTDVWGDYLGDDGTVLYSKESDHTYRYDYSKGQTTNLSWPDGTNGNKLLFFFEAPYRITKIQPEFVEVPSETGGASTYKLPADFTGTYNKIFNIDGSIEFDYVSPALADNQEDILFTSKWITKAENDKVIAGKAAPHNILLYHALTAVKFKVGNDFPEGIQLEFTKVTFTNIYKSGHCTVKPNYKDDTNTSAGNPSNEEGLPATKSALCSLWSSLGTQGECSVEFPLKGGDAMGNKTVGKLSGDEAPTVTFPDGFYRETTSEETIADRNLNTTSYSKTFLFIPQDVTPKTTGGAMIDGAQTAINVEYYIIRNGEREGQRTSDGSSKPFSKTIYLPTETWKAGELRTFTLNGLAVHVSIDDTMNSANTVKSGLATTNEGTAPQYQRVLVTANWIYDDANYGPSIVAPYDIIKKGTDGKPVSLNTKGFTKFPGEGWLIGEDGFFYYVNPIDEEVQPDKPLFDTFTQTMDSPYPGAHLEMSLSVQAVKYELSHETVNAYWFSTIGGGSNPHVYSLDKNNISNYVVPLKESTNDYIKSNLTDNIETAE